MVDRIDRLVYCCLNLWQFSYLFITVALILNTEFADAIKGKWKPGDESVRKFPIDRTLQSDKIISTEKTVHTARRIQNVGKMQNVRRFQDQTLQNFRRFTIERTLQNIRGLPDDRTLQNVRGLPNDRALQNVRGPPNDRIMQNVRGLSNDGILQNVRKFPADRTLQNVRGFPVDRTLQNIRRLSNDRILQNVRGIFNDRTLHNVKEIPDYTTFQNVTVLPKEKTLPSDKRISILKTLQNARTVQIDDKMQKDRRVSVEIEFPNDRRIQYKKRLHSPRMNVSDGIMHNEKRINVNRLLEHNRRSQNELKKKIDSLMQNDNIQLYEMGQEGRSILGAKIQNGGQSPAILNDKNRRNLDELNQESFPVTPHPSKKLDEGAVDEPSFEFNSSEMHDVLDIPVEEDRGSGWANFWRSIVLFMEHLRGILPPGHHLMTIRTCYTIAHTYITALSDFKRYYMMRGFYENNLEFEVGYLVSEIVSKYQRMIELFNIVTDYYFNYQAKTHAVSIYVFYMYTNVLEMGTVITHLCNMLTEIEDKYRFIPVPQSGFSDYHLIKVMDDKDKVSKANAILAYEKKMAKLKREKLRQQKKMRDKTLHIGMVVTTPDRRPKYRSWPLVYGWSIETWW